VTHEPQGPVPYSAHGGTRTRFKAKKTLSRVRPYSIPPCSCWIRRSALFHTVPFRFIENRDGGGHGEDMKIIRIIEALSAGE